MHAGNLLQVQGLKCTKQRSPDPAQSSPRRKGPKSEDSSGTKQKDHGPGELPRPRNSTNLFGPPRPQTNSVWAKWVLYTKLSKSTFQQIQPQAHQSPGVVGQPRNGPAQAEPVRSVCYRLNQGGCGSYRLGEDMWRRQGGGVALKQGETPHGQISSSYK